MIDSSIYFLGARKFTIQYHRLIYSHERVFSCSTLISMYIRNMQFHKEKGKISLLLIAKLEKTQIAIIPLVKNDLALL